MQIILIDDVFEVGRRGEVVSVADGYGRNYLIPKKLAIPATQGNLKMIQEQRLAMAKKEAKYKGEAELLADELGSLHVIVSRKSGETGTLFGSVTSKDITKLLAGSGIQLDRRKILLDQPVKAIGNYQIELRPHSDVSAQILLSVVIEGEEHVARVKKRDEESEKMVADLEAKLKEIRQSTGMKTTVWQPPESEVAEVSSEGQDEGVTDSQPELETTPAAESVDQEPDEGPDAQPE